jgi:hypothetical protein
MTTEAPWPAGPRDAVIDWSPINADGFDGIGTLWFVSPETEGWHAEQRCAINVSRTCADGGTEIGRTNIWKFTDNGDGTATVRPSVHLIGHFHSPSPVIFRLVDALPERD